MQKFAAFDIDKTHYQGTLAHDFIKQLVADKVIPSDLAEVAKYLATPNDQTLIAALKAAQTSARMDFASYSAVGRLAGLAASKHLNAKTDKLFNDLRERGFTMIAISTSPYAVVKPFCDAVGPYDFVIAPMASNVNGVVGERSLVRGIERTKADWLRRLVDLLGLSWEESLAIGDSMSDASMLEIVERPIAYKPDEKLAHLAVKNSWEIWS